MRDPQGRMLPDFLGIGPGRTGTTWLHQALEGHVDLPHGIKETGFFGVRFSKGIDWYAQHFRYASGNRKVEEFWLELVPGTSALRWEPQTALTPQQDARIRQRYLQNSRKRRERPDAMCRDGSEHVRAGLPDRRTSSRSPAISFWTDHSCLKGP